VKAARAIEIAVVHKVNVQIGRMVQLTPMP